MTKLRALGLLFSLVPALAFASGGGDLAEAQVDLSDRASLQRGAGYFMNYCSGCHSINLIRYSRIAGDLGLSEDEVMANLNFRGQRIGEQVRTGLDPADGAAWFGKAPPDLSLVARAKLGGPDWTYTFLRSFYVDESRPLGWNNTLLPNASMPNPLWQLQGMQRAVYEESGEGHAAAAGTHPPRLELAQPGRLEPEQFDQVARDITAFLTYVGEPAALKRESIGVWVVLFLSFFTFLAWLLKREYWRDVH
jgi:ubiquinol-cytochrome c reductase cytochrome c1 subunit